MKARTAVLMALFGLVLAAPAEAKWHAAVPLPPHWPTMYHADCPYSGVALGCAQGWVDDRCQSPSGCVWLSSEADRYDRMHELGHIFDWQVLTDLDRRRFTRMLGLSGDWIKYDTHPGAWSTSAMDSPHEWFADAYAHCALKRDGLIHHHSVVVEFGYFDPSHAQYVKLCAAIRFVALG